MSGEYDRLTFEQRAEGAWRMTRYTELGDSGETASSEYRFVAEPPADLARQTGRYVAPNGMVVLTGTVIEDGLGHAVAWPEDPKITRINL